VSNLIDVMCDWCGLTCASRGDIRRSSAYPNSEHTIKADEYNALLARAEAAERVVSAARDVMHVRFIGSGDRYRQCVQCGAMSLYADVDVSHHEGCTGSALRAAIADYDAQRTEDDGE
jgi:hypothetical protein